MAHSTLSNGSGGNRSGGAGVANAGRLGVWCVSSDASNRWASSSASRSERSMVRRYSQTLTHSVMGIRMWMRRWTVGSRQWWEGMDDGMTDEGADSSQDGRSGWTHGWVSACVHGCIGVCLQKRASRNGQVQRGVTVKVANDRDRSAEVRRPTDGLRDILILTEFCYFYFR